MNHLPLPPLIPAVIRSEIVKLLNSSQWAEIPYLLQELSILVPAELPLQDLPHWLKQYMSTCARNPEQHPTLNAICEGVVQFYLFADPEGSALSPINQALRHYGMIFTVPQGQLQCFSKPILGSVSLPQSESENPFHSIRQRRQEHLISQGALK